MRTIPQSESMLLKVIIPTYNTAHLIGREEKMRDFIPANVTIRNNTLPRNWRTIWGNEPRGKGLCLDYGAGRGEKRPSIEGKGWTYIGFDILQSSKLTLVADGLRLPFADCVFDCVFMCQVLEHIPNPYDALREVKRVIRPGGILCGSVSFLEPFHDSYFNMSHWGISHLLQDCGFSSIVVEPGSSAIRLFLHSVPLIGGSWLGSFITKCLTGIVLLAYNLMLPILNLMGGHLKGVVALKRFFEEFPLRYAGHILFYVKK